MYIEYITPQRVADKVFAKYKSKGGDYRPTWLIRTSDWVKVPGHEASDGYHTLSYCWEQSGEKILKEDGEEYDLIDGPHHRVTKIEREKRSIFNWFHHREETVVTHEVTYNKLLQQVCKDFDIEYLWYDKICIDQTNKEEKKREIKQMHRIYGNARYTIALVPEVNITDPKQFDKYSKQLHYTEAKGKAHEQMEESLWWKRSWTLEEVMVSSQILIVGRNTHFWSLSSTKQGKRIKDADTLSTVMLAFRERKVKSANQVLAYAHRRTSTKEHDKIFALANIFHGIIDIDISYKSNFSAVMNSFYRQLAQLDLSIMCFGANYWPWNGNTRRVTTMNSYDLPSWTGVAGLHSDRGIASTVLDGNTTYNLDDDMLLHLRCRGFTIQPNKYNDYAFFVDEERLQRASANLFKTINSMDDFDGDETAALDWSIWSMTHMSDFVPTHYYLPDAACSSPVISFSLTEECDECIILGVILTSVAERLRYGKPIGSTYSYLSPVVKKSTDGLTYKAVGVTHLKTFQIDEPRKSPEEFMNDMFSQLNCSEYQDFNIK